ncbi:NADH:flavin oxidoreductase/NADH oxidase [Streptococcus cameli]
MSQLLSPVSIAGLELKNRIVMPPMCMYEVHKEDGFPTFFHQAHYGARAIGQVGLIILEATAVEPDGRLTNRDLGIWSDKHVQPLQELVANLHQVGSKVGIQLNHGGRKAQDAVDLIAPSALAYNDDFGLPREMTLQDIERVKEAFIDGGRRAQDAGFDMLELHAAHGYLLHQFLEPLINQRQDDYGGSLENRYRLLKEIVTGVKEVFSGSLWIRLSLTAYDESGQENTLTDWQTIAQWLERDGVHALDISTGGLIEKSPNIPIYPGYQVPFSNSIKQVVSIPVTAVGLIQSPELAEQILRSKQADLIQIGRGLLQNANWANHAASLLHDKNFQEYNRSYQRGFYK